MAFLTPFEEAFKYLKQKIRQPTKHWRDIDGRAHDRAFVVAGATKDAFLVDIHNAIIEAVADGMRGEEFYKRFEEIVAAHGWTGWTGEKTPEGRAWRARVIYETNIRTAYAAGRWKQMTDPKMVKVRPYWQYKHGFLRTPKIPRQDHIALDGVVLDWDNPIWKVIYPPNGWGCSCGVQPLSRRQLAQLGKTGPDETPKLTYKKIKEPRTGEMIEVPDGIGFGWDHAPGADWADGLVPAELQVPLPEKNTIPDGQRGLPVPDNLPALSSYARESNIAPLKPDQSPEYYVDAILHQFGASRGPDGAKLIRDKSGHFAIISDALFKDYQGNWKVFKADRATEYAQAIEALTDPDEIWVNWDKNLQTGVTNIRKRYLRYNAGKQSLAVFEWGNDGWEGTTLFVASSSDKKKRDKYIEKQRSGNLLWRRVK